MREFRVRIEGSEEIDRFFISENVEVGFVEIASDSSISNYEAVVEYLRELETDRKLNKGEPFRILWYSATGGLV